MTHSEQNTNSVTIKVSDDKYDGREYGGDDGNEYKDDDDTDADTNGDDATNCNVASHVQ